MRYKQSIIYLFCIINCYFMVGYGAEISISPSQQILSCGSDYNFDIILNTSGDRVVAADIKFFLDGLDLTSIQSLGGFDQFNNVGTGIATKGVNVGKTYYYLNFHQNSFANGVSGENIFLARLNLQPISGYNNGSVIFYNLGVSDDDSNVAVGLDYSINNFPTKYFDSLSTVIDGNYSFINCTSVSCSLNGIIIPNGGSIVAYKNNLVPCLSTCLFETRTCNNGVLNGSYVNLSCSVESCQPQPPNLGGGGGSYLLKDDCPDGDNSPSYYDNSCGGLHSSPNICDVDNSNYSSEIKGAYLYSYGYSITTMCPIVEADLDGYLRRNHFAKMISQFATNVLGDQPNIGKEGCDKFKDIDGDTDELKGFMKKSCELGLMGLEADGITPYEVFNPSSFVTRAEFGTVFSRLLFGLKYNIKDESIVFNQKGFWYKDHLDALNRYGVMTKIDGDWPQKLELRGWIMLMMQRADMYGIFAGKIPALNGIKALFE